ncbi:class I SAM-dependent methyltransferase [Zhihengliuella halotolerans]|uniref:Methyltransferase family protein n=1 Tax=Zhihengliuella halotolerans TaxID=370736 RepID=A0A4Q8AGF0_9MICC|nr:methyltransferase domain-containing protein [Zhihengliuella halotolerans]RZU63378.1 methyltransferase family protein [Zhihengliuella halotolerans]
MRTFEEKVAAAAAADVTGWGFGFLDGRATEERPPWGYVRRLADALSSADAALDLDTGGGEVLAEALDLSARRPVRAAATEGWEPNLVRARERLHPLGVEVMAAGPGAPLPFAAGSFDLVTSRHPVAPDWAEIARVLRPGGGYLAQHVGPASAFELVEYFLGPQPEARKGRDPEREAEQARGSGLDVDELLTARCRMEFFDIGAVVWILRKCPWWVPDFTPARYEAKLRQLDAQLRSEPFVAHSTRHLIRATRVGPAERRGRAAR